MNGHDDLKGLNCPNCGGIVEIPEGELIVRCPYCDLRSMVKGDRGIIRYQVPLRIDRIQAENAYRHFLSSSRAIDSNTSRAAELSEAFIAYMPFWAAWSRVLGWVFGEKQVGSGDDKRYEPREVKIAEDMTWNAAACDVGEFGVEAIPRIDPSLEPFNAEVLHASGMVFEPVGLLAEAQKQAESEFTAQVEKKARLDRLSQVFVRFIRRRIGLVYYPLWVLRYLYRGRAYQVVVDGYNGEILYGKAPGSTFYRAAVLVGGMAAGALIAVDVSSLVLYLAANSDDDEGGLFFAGLALIGLGIGIMVKAYRKFRFGEIYEFRKRVGRARGSESDLTTGSRISAGLRQVRELLR